MSWEVVKLVHEYPYLTAVENSVLVCYATFANDDGTNVYPSNATVERMTKLTEPAVRRAKARLVRDGILIDQGVHPQLKSVVYRIDVALLKDKTPSQRPPVSETPRLTDPPSEGPSVCETPTPVCETLPPVSQTPNKSGNTNKTPIHSLSACADEEPVVEEPPLDEWEALPGLKYPEPLRDGHFRNLWQMWMRCRADSGRALNLWSTQQALSDLAKEGLDRAVVIVATAVRNGFQNLRFEVADEADAKSKTVQFGPDELRDGALQIIQDSVEGDVPETVLALLTGYHRMLSFGVKQHGKHPKTPTELVPEIKRFSEAWGGLPADLVAETAEYFCLHERWFPPPGGFASRGREIYAKRVRSNFTVTPVPTEYERNRRMGSRPAGHRPSTDPQSLADAKRMPGGV